MTGGEDYYTVRWVVLTKEDRARFERADMCERFQVGLGNWAKIREWRGVEMPTGGTIRGERRLGDCNLQL
jgi:hypothetical protein